LLNQDPDLDIIIRDLQILGHRILNHRMKKEDLEIEINVLQDDIQIQRIRIQEDRGILGSLGGGEKEILHNRISEDLEILETLNIMLLMVQERALFLEQRIQKERRIKEDLENSFTYRCVV